MGKSKRKNSNDDDSDAAESSPSPLHSSEEDDRRRSRSTTKRRRSRDTESDFDSDSDDNRRRSSKRKRKESKKHMRKHKSSSRREKKERDTRDGERKSGSRSRRKESRIRVSDEESGSLAASESERENGRVEPESVVMDLMREFPGVAGDLKQLLHGIDNGQAVDIKGISEKLLVRHLKKLFVSLKLKENGDGVFLLRSNARPTLEIVGPLISPQVDEPRSVKHDINVEKVKENDNLVAGTDEASGPRRRMIGPAMPSAELLAAAAKLTEAQAELRDAQLEDDDGFFIGPPPPAVVAEAESSNEAERFEEITRIMGNDDGNPYDILGVNHKMSIDNVKKRYWKLSLMVHPDKCSHPQAHQAFVKLNKAFKDLQDPDKRKTLDDKIKKKEEEEEMKIELRSMREAAQWRRSQGISMEGDDILLADIEVKQAPKRDEWMTSLPPERKAGGVSMQSTTFSRSGKEGRGDTSAWTDTPSDRAQKAKMNYLEAYNAATALASSEKQKMASNTDADLVDQYNKSKRSKSLVQKHQEEEAERSRPKKKTKHQLRQQTAEEEWVGKHPWKPWDREKDLTAGRQSVKLDPENLTQGLTSRFSSGTFQRNFL
ncbi:GPALPP motifs-containing protein [Drosera capensis]